MGKDPGKKTFMRITNRDIWNTSKEIKKTVEEIKLHVKETNGKVQLNRKWLYGVSTIMLAILAWALNLSIGG